MSEFDEDYYAILGIDEAASAEEIRKSYLKLAKKLHPDRFPHDPETRSQAQREFAQVTRAHDVISDPQRRAEYDALRQLAKSRMALKSGEPGTVGAAEPSLLETAVTGENVNIKWADRHLVRAGELYRKKRYQEAETAIKEAIRLVPNDTRYHNMLAEIYLGRGWRTLAMTEIQASLRIDPKGAEAKNLETTIKAQLRGGAPAKASQPGKSKGLMDQIKDLLHRKTR